MRGNRLAGGGTSWLTHSSSATNRARCTAEQSAGLGVTYPGRVNELAELDYGSQPPQSIPDHDYVVFVPAIDEDGNEMSGVRVPEISVPRGTHTGWSARRPGHAEGGLTLLGSFFPFARTRQERLDSGDPRLSLEERYASEDDYLGRIAAAARALVADRLLLDEDVASLVEAARRALG